MDLKKLNNIKEDFKQERNVLHKKLVERYTWAFKTLDVLMIMVILMNFGAAFLTSLMVAKEKPEMEFVEANPIQAEMKGYETTPEAKNMFYAFAIQATLWLVMIFCYIYWRCYAFTELHLILFSTVVIGYFLILGYDFWNNFGYYLGVSLWG